MKVMVGAPVRNRGWILPRHLDALLEQDEVEVEFLYVVNDCVDNTVDVLEHYNIPYVTNNLSAENSHERGYYKLDSLAVLRNRLLDEFIKSDCDYLFSIDTDIIIPDGSLKKLIEDDKEIISMLIKNNPTIPAHNIMRYSEEFDRVAHFEITEEGIIEGDLTGAVYLIRREAIEAGVRYGYHWIGEDAYFSEKAKELGYKLYCDTRLRPIHAFDKQQDLVAEVIR